MQGTSPAECEYPDGTMVHIFGIAGPNGLYSWGAYYPVGYDNDAFIQLNQQVYENFFYSFIIFFKIVLNLITESESELLNAL